MCECGGGGLYSCGRQWFWYSWGRGAAWVVRRHVLQSQHLSIGSLEKKIGPIFQTWDILDLRNIVKRMQLIGRAGYFCFPHINLQLSLNANNVNVKSGANYIKPI